MELSGSRRVSSCRCYNRGDVTIGERTVRGARATGQVFPVGLFHSQSQAGFIPALSLTSFLFITEAQQQRLNSLPPTQAARTPE